MLKLFKKTPTVEEFRNVVFRYLKSKGVSMPSNTTIVENIIGFTYQQEWILENRKLFLTVFCKDVRKTKPVIDYEFMSMGLS